MPRIIGLKLNYHLALRRYASVFCRKACANLVLSTGTLGKPSYHYSLLIRLIICMGFFTVKPVDAKQFLIEYVQPEKQQHQAAYLL